MSLGLEWGVKEKLVPLSPGGDGVPWPEQMWVDPRLCNVSMLPSQSRPHMSNPHNLSAQNMRNLPDVTLPSHTPILSNPTNTCNAPLNLPSQPSTSTSPSSPLLCWVIRPITRYVYQNIPDRHPGFVPSANTRSFLGISERTG